MNRHWCLAAVLVLALSGCSTARADSPQGDCDPPSTSAQPTPSASASSSAKPSASATPSSSASAPPSTRQGQVKVFPKGHPETGGGPLLATVPCPSSSSKPTPSKPSLPAGASKTSTASLTGYSFADNTPRNSAKICCPVLHREAGGTGTFLDPITTAVPGSGSGMETPKGTRLYIPKLRRYFIVEDSGATGTGKLRFDVWVDGRGFPDESAEKCMNQLTGPAQVVLHPGPGHPVTVGPLTGPDGCKI